jgi:hypothetical protein
MSELYRLTEGMQSVLHEMQHGSQAEAQKLLTELITQNREQLREYDAYVARMEAAENAWLKMGAQLEDECPF